jgi:hypothetical protein
MVDLVRRWLLVLLALTLTVAASGSMAMIAMNTWGVQCPRPIGGLIFQGLFASLLWTAALTTTEQQEGEGDGPATT